MAFMRFNNSAVSWAEMANEPKQPIKTANTMRCIQSPFCGTDWYTVHESPRGARISAGYATTHATNAGSPLSDGWRAAECRRELRIEAGGILFRRNLPVKNDCRADVG